MFGQKRPKKVKSQPAMVYIFILCLDIFHFKFEIQKDILNMRCVHYDATIFKYHFYHL